MKKISIVTSCYNEEENVELLYKQIKEVMTALKGYTYEIIYKYEIYVEDDVDLLSEIMDLQISGSSLKAQKIFDLINIEISFEHVENEQISTMNNGTDIDAHLVKIYVKLTMNDVKDYTTYDEINGKTLSFDYLLTISKT